MAAFSIVCFCFLFFVIVCMCIFHRGLRGEMWRGGRGGGKWSRWRGRWGGKGEGVLGLGCRAVFFLCVYDNMSICVI